AHESQPGRSLKSRVEELLQQVHLAERAAYSAYPHELSGGEQRRVVIAQALACRPLLIVADEPTASLDRSVQVKILELFEQIRREFRISFLLTSHDSSVLSHLADRLLLMSGGRVVAEQPLRIPGRRFHSVSVTRPPEREPDGHSSSLQSPVSQTLLSL